MNLVWGNSSVKVNRNSDVVKMPRMEKVEYDALIEEEHVCRIAFKGDRHPHIAPFIYVFDGRRMYFLSSRYGRKIEYFKRDPNVCVEVERYSRDLSSFCFVSLMGRLEVVEDPEVGRKIREMFVGLITDRKLSKNILSAFGYSPEDPLEYLSEVERNMVWKLVDVVEIVGLRGS